MTRPDPRQNTGLPPAMSGAVDLSSLKNNAENSARPGASASGAAPSAGSTPPAESANVVEVTESTFQSEVLERSLRVPVVVDLWATWCGPCKQLSPVLEKLAGESGGSWVLAKVDVDANPRIPQLFQVQSIPTVIAIANGQPVEAFAGAQPEPRIREWINSLLDSMRDQLPGIRQAEQAAAEPEPEAEEDPRFTAAEDAVEQGDYAAAEAAYQRILAQEPENEQAKAALTQVRFTARAENADPAAIQRADAAPEDIDAQLAAADAELAVQQVEAGFDRLVRTVKHTSGEQRTRVREYLLEMFELFPEDDRRVLAARRALASALF